MAQSKSMAEVAVEESIKLEAYLEQMMSFDGIDRTIAYGRAMQCLNVITAMGNRRMELAAYERLRVSTWEAIQAELPTPRRQEA